MDLDGYVEMIMDEPTLSGWNATPENKTRGCRSAIGRALNKICRAYDFHFAVDDKTDSTVVDQANYTCKGNKSQCADILTVKYDGAKYQLPKKSEQQRDVAMEGRTGTLTSIQFWTPTGIVNGHPEITFYGTPGTVVNFAYHYRRMNIDPQEFPSLFSDTLVDVAIDILFGKAQVSQQYGNSIFRVSSPDSLAYRSKRAIEEMIDNYARDENLYPDPPIGNTWRKKNRLRNQRFGYHG